MKSLMSPRRLLLQTTALVAFAGPALAQNCDAIIVPIPADCERMNAEVVVEMPVGRNTERVQSVPGGSFASTGFSISIEDQTIAGAPAPRDPQRRERLQHPGGRGGRALRLHGRRFREASRNRAFVSMSHHEQSDTGRG